MTIEEVIYNIKRIITRSNVTIESRFSDAHILTLLDSARIFLIAEAISKNEPINQDLFQSLGLLTLNPTDEADTLLDMDAIPEPIPFYGSIGLTGVYTNTAFETLSVYTSNRRKKIQSVSYDRLLDVINMNHPAMELYGFANYDGELLRVYPYQVAVQVYAIMKSVLTGFDKDSTHQETIKSGVSYTVVTGSIEYYGLDEHGAIEAQTLVQGTVFTGFQGYPVYVPTIGQSTILVRYTNINQPVTYGSAYPANSDMIRKMTMLLLTQEFKLENDVAADLIYDMVDETGKR